MIYHYDKDGNPIGLMEWARLLADANYCRVAEHWVRGYRVSTIWLGLNHNFMGGPPLIFETMVFAPGDAAGGESIRFGVDQRRYSTLGQARAGHARTLAQLVKVIGADPTRDVLLPGELRADDVRVPDDLSGILESRERPAPSGGASGNGPPSLDNAVSRNRITAPCYGRVAITYRIQHRAEDQPTAVRAGKGRRHAVSRRLPGM